MKRSRAAWSRGRGGQPWGVTLLSLSALTLCVPQAEGCGVNAHTWISDSAICQLPVGSELQGLMARQELVDLVRIGASFPDSGYPIDHAYAERAHWSPFMEACVRRFQERYPPSEPLSEEGLREAAFLLGVASHGLEDELFDTQFLRWTAQEDQVGQDEIDVALDFFLVADGHTELNPQPELPLLTVIEAFQSTGLEVTEEEIYRGYDFIRVALNLTQRPEGAELLAARRRPDMPWSASHYLDPEVTGSLAHEPRVISRQLELNWARLRGQLEAQGALIAVSPELLEGERLDPVALERRSEGGWITLYFGVGVDVLSLRERLSLRGGQGEQLDFEWRSTRWGGGEGLTRIFQLMPITPLGYDERLTVHVEPGVSLVNETVTIEPWIRDFRVQCAAPPCEGEAPQERANGGRSRGCWVPEAGVEPSAEAGVAAGGQPASTGEGGAPSAVADEGTSRGDTGGCAQRSEGRGGWLIIGLLAYARRRALLRRGAVAHR